MLDGVFQRLPIKECDCVMDTTASRTLHPASKWYFSKMRIVQVWIFFIGNPLKEFSKLVRHAFCRAPQCKDVGL